MFQISYDPHSYETNILQLRMEAFNGDNGDTGATR